MRQPHSFCRDVAPVPAEDGGSRFQAAVTNADSSIPKGAAYNNLYHVYFEFEGNKIVRAHEYNDTAHVFDTLRARERRPAG